MSFFWVFLWFVLSLFILGVFFWSLDILFKQKKVWKKFAEDHNLTYIKGPLFSSPIVQGTFGGHNLTLYSEEQISPGARSKKFRTVMALSLATPMSCGGVVASPVLRAFADSLENTTDLHIESADWNSDRVVKSDNPAVLEKYLKTGNRLKALNSLMKHKTTSLLYIFDQLEAILRVETPNPLYEKGKLDKIMNAVKATADVLVLSDEEIEQFEQSQKKPAKKKQAQESKDTQDPEFKEEKKPLAEETEVETSSDKDADVKEKAEE